MTQKQTNPTLAPSARYKARASVFAALLRRAVPYIVKNNNHTYVMCSACLATAFFDGGTASFASEELARDGMIHDPDCVVSDIVRALAADDAAIRAMAAEMAQVEGNE